jgi:ribonucleoside-triphosphate reductase
MNVPTRVGFQTPFTNITLDLNVPKHYKDEPVMIGGKYQKEKYGDFQKRMDLFNRVLFEVYAEGDAEDVYLLFYPNLQYN